MNSYKPTEEMRRMNIEMQGKIAIVTGSARGIGKAIAQKMVACGAKVVVSDVLTKEGEATAAELGPSAIFIPCDISDKAAVSSLIDTTVQRFGRLDVMVNNAGINAALGEERVTLDKYMDKTWDRIMQVDLNGTFYCCRAAAQQMVKQKSGSIVNISSVAGVVALRLQIAFVAAKAAIIKLTEAMACELGPMGIRTNAVSPGSTDVTAGRLSTVSESEGGYRDRAQSIISFIPEGRLGYPEEMADAVLFLASDAGAYINGHNLVVDGGWTCGFNRDW
jgi:NAD(P)-dependent dehydrogenase (short-subunit alcohol dehydrogenase family)